MEERIFKLSLEKAKMWYNGSSEDLRRIALEVYTEEELTKVELPNSWEEYLKRHTIYDGEMHSLIFIYGIPDKYCALAKLELLRDCYRQGRIPNWNTTKNKYVILRDSSQLWVNSELCKERFLTFDTEELAKKFLDNFKDLIEEAGDLI